MNECLRKLVFNSARLPSGCVHAAKHTHPIRGSQHYFLTLLGYLSQLGMVSRILEMAMQSDTTVKNLRNSILLYVSQHLIQNDKDDIVLPSVNLLEMMGLAHYSCSFDVELLSFSGESHLMYLDAAQPGYIFDLPLSALPRNPDKVDGRYEDTKRTHEAWLRKYKHSVWKICNFDDLLACTEPL